MRFLAWTAGVLIAGVFAFGVVVIATAPTKVHRAEFIPGQKVRILVGNSTIEAIYVGMTPRERVIEAFEALDEARQLAANNGMRG